MSTMLYPFSEAQMERAAAEWGCNCGPSALAFALQLPLEAARHAIPEFDRKRYTSPSMMTAALSFLNRSVVAIRKPTRDDMFQAAPCLVRLQWGGPWCKPGVNPKAAYGCTHWITTWKEGPEREGGVPLVFDCNGGVNRIDEWEAQIVPLLLPARGDHTWFPTHVWQVLPKAAG